MIALLAVVIVLFGTVANLHWHGAVADEQRATENELNEERERLDGWARRLVAREAGAYRLTPQELHHVEQTRALFDQDQQDLIDATVPAFGDSADGGTPSRAPSADIPWGTDAL